MAIIINNIKYTTFKKLMLRIKLHITSTFIINNDYYYHKINT